MDNKIIHKRDHLILPKSTLMRFVDAKNEISVLDLNDAKNIFVKSVRPKSYHVEENYYNPEYDEEVQKRETLIGRLCTKISKAVSEIESGRSLSYHFVRDELKQQILDLVTIEYNRLVIVDDEKLSQYREHQQKRNDEEDKKLLAAGVITKDRVDYSINYREKAKSLSTFRNYSQNILGSKNDVIENQYKDFYSYILYVPNGQGYSFWLPPFHFIGNECFLDFILSPNIVLALYPDAQLKTSNPIQDGVFYTVEKQMVDTINLRTLESIMTMPTGFREIIGNRNDLINLKCFIEQLRNNSSVSEKTIRLSNLKKLIYDEISVLRTAIVLYILFQESDAEFEVIIEPDSVEKSYIRSDNNGEIEKIFKKYGFNFRVEC